MFKVIFKTAIKTLLIVAVIVLVAFGVASLGFPSQMAGLCEKSGNYSMATGYASISHFFSKDVNDLNRCFTDSVYAGNDNNIVKYGDRLIVDEKFTEVCESITVVTVKIGDEEIEVPVDYMQFVYGRLAAAKYRKGDKDKALEVATSAMADEEGFPVNNALAHLSLQVIESNDKDTANKLLAEIEDNHAATDSDYYNALIKELKSLGAED